MGTPNDVLRIAREEIGYSRWNDPQTGTKYGRWYAQNHGDYYGENGVPFCAMFCSWVLSKASVECAGFPGAYCPWIVSAGVNAGMSINIYDARSGDIVLFEWNFDGESDHVGIVEENCGSYLQCIEGNTNNGQVARRNRYWDNICCIIRPYYDSSQNDSAIDGGNSFVKLGQNYLNRWGYDLGRYGVDGVDGADTRSARIKYAQYNMSCYGANLEVDGIRGSATEAGWNRLGGVRLFDVKIYMVKAVQIALSCHGYNVGDFGIDGVYGADTERTVVAFQKDNGLAVDGFVGVETFKMLF